MAFQVVAVEKEADDEFVHVVAFGKGEGFADQPPHALTDGVIEAFDMIGGAAFGVGGAVLGGGQDIVIAFQLIGVQEPLAVGGGDAGIELSGGGVVARPQGVGHDLAGAPVEGQPQPDHPAPTMTDKGPHFIQFQGIVRLGRHQGFLQRRQTQGFF